MGLVGSTVGLGVGYLLALGLRWLFGVFGLDLSRADFPMTWSAVFWSYVVGVGVTAVAALLPARRASRIAPMAALRDDVALPESTLRRRVLIGTVLVLLGAGAMAVGLGSEGTWALLGIGGGILLVLVGVYIMSAFLGQPVLHLFGAVYRRTFGMVGRLAAQNALRNPRRTGATASALMFGLALMSMMSIFGSSASASTDAAIGKSLTSQFIVSNVVGQPFSHRRRRAGTPPRRRLRRDPAAQRLPRAQGRRQRLDGRRRPEGVRARLLRPHGRGFVRRR